MKFLPLFFALFGLSSATTNPIPGGARYYQKDDTVSTPTLRLVSFTFIPVNHANTIVQIANAAEPGEPFYSQILHYQLGFTAPRVHEQTFVRLSPWLSRELETVTLNKNGDNITVSGSVQTGSGEWKINSLALSEIPLNTASKSDGVVRLLQNDPGVTSTPLVVTLVRTTGDINGQRYFVLLAKLASPDNGFYSQVFNLHSSANGKMKLVQRSFLGNVINELDVTLNDSDAVISGNITDGNSTYEFNQTKMSYGSCDNNLRTRNLLELLGNSK